MRIAILTFGSRGDVQPFIALGKGLTQAGHDVLLLAPPDAQDLAEQHGISLSPVQSSFRKLVESPQSQGLLKPGQSPFGLLTRLSAALTAELEYLVTAVKERARGVDALICHVIMLPIAQTLADALNVPLLYACLQPSYAASDEPQFLLPSLPFHSPTYNLAGGRVLRWLYWRLAATAVHRVRTQILGLPPESYRQFVQRLLKTPVLCGYSGKVVPVAADAEPFPTMCGYFFLNTEGYTPPRQLAAFLEAGPPPVYVGFGSMATPDSRATAELVMQALKLAGERGILLTGWGGMDPRDCPDSILPIDSVPHDWLFPKTAAVIHHGGAGTTSAMLRAGVPGLITPGGGDMPYWGRKAAQLGVALPPIPFKELSVARLAAAIRRLTQDSGLRARAHAFGEQIRGEDGVGRAVAAIEQYLRPQSAT